MTTHRLKTWPTQFRAIQAGLKTFEFRRDDRGFDVGDRLLLEEWDPARGDGAYTGQSLVFTAGYILRGGDPATGGAFQLQAGYCVISLLRAPADDPS